MTRRKVLLHAPGGTLHVPIFALQSSGWDVLISTTTSAATALLVEHDAKIGLISFNAPVRDGAGLTEIEELVFTHRSIEWIALVSDSALRSCDLPRFISQRCYDYHTMPLDVDRLLLTLGHAFGKAELQSRVAAQPENQYGMVGISPVMQELYRKLHKLQRTDAPVLVRGESGTGKELVARAIYQSSCRSASPFVVVSCGAVSTHLIQAELFGYEKGAFTGADRRTVGKIEAASGGTVLLDEIGNFPFDLQVNLLRFLEAKTIQRLGSHHEIAVDVRIIATTHVDLEAAVQRGHFREDLYYRLNVLSLEVPPLRYRDGDIELLAKTYFEKFSRERKSHAKGFSAEALRTLNIHPWRGNVRELCNRIRRAVVISDSHLISPMDLGLERRISATRSAATLSEARAMAERAFVERVLRQNKHNVSEAARQLGISRKTLYRLMNKTPGHCDALASFRNPKI